MSDVNLDGRHMPDTPLTDLWQLMTVYQSDKRVGSVKRPDGRVYPVENHVVTSKVMDIFLNRQDSQPDPMLEIEAGIVGRFNHHFHNKAMELWGGRYQLPATPRSLRGIYHERYSQYRDMKMIIPEHRWLDFHREMEPPLLSGQIWRDERSVEFIAPLTSSYMGSYPGIEIHMMRGIETGMLFSTSALWLWIEGPFRIHLSRNPGERSTEVIGTASYAMGLDNAEMWARVV